MSSLEHLLATLRYGTCGFLIFAPHLCMTLQLQA